MGITRNVPLSKAIAAKYGHDEEYLALVLSVAPNEASDSEIANFLYQAARTGLDPMARQIYLVKRGGSCTVQTGIDGYRLVADRTGQYIGSSDPLYDEGLTQYEWLKTGREVPMTATITISKAVAGTIGQFTASAAWDSYYPGKTVGYMWTKLPLLMLGKVAEALALRKAFPAALSGIYISEEMMQAGDGKGDVVEGDVLEGLGIKNEHAIKVLDKLKAADIEADDHRIVEYLGSTINDVPATAEGSDLLKEIWKAASQVVAGKVSADDALDSLGK